MSLFDALGEGSNFQLDFGWYLANFHPSLMCWHIIALILNTIFSFWDQHIALEMSYKSIVNIKKGKILLIFLIKIMTMPY